MGVVCSSAHLRRRRPSSKMGVHSAPNAPSNPLIDKEGGRLSRRWAHVKIVRGDFGLREPAMHARSSPHRKPGAGPGAALWKVSTASGLVRVWPSTCTHKSRSVSNGCPMSALPPKADITAAQTNVRFVPKADVAVPSF